MTAVNHPERYFYKCFIIFIIIPRTMFVKQTANNLRL